MLNILLIWQLCSNHHKGPVVMYEDPVASPWCSKHCSLSVLCCITHNCLTPFWHGHSVELGLSSVTYHTSLFGEVCVYACHGFLLLTSVCFSLYGEEMGIIIAIHQRICVTPSYFLSSRLRFWYYTLISFAPLLSAVVQETKKLHSSRMQCTFMALSISFKIVFVENRKNVGFNISYSLQHLVWGC